MVATNKDGEAYGTYNYTAFGNQLESTDNTNPFRYCGEYYDEESGMTYLRNRYYNSTTGRFISEDPIRDGLNWYVYCAGNPINSWDPLGLERLDDDEINELRKQQQIVIAEQEETIDIYVALNFVYQVDPSLSLIEQSGNINNKKDLFMQGIKKHWAGTFEYKNVNVIIDDVTDSVDNEYCAVDIHLNLDSNKRCYTYTDYDLFQNGSIHKGNTLYVEMNTLSFTSMDVEMAAGHEFGHVLGIGDFYNVPEFSGISSIMQSSYAGRYAQPIDYNLMMRSYLQNRFFYFLNDNTAPNSEIDNARAIVHAIHSN